eukprot:jgi/Chlat1/1327/Chrsp118S01721
MPAAKAAKASVDNIVTVSKRRLTVLDAWIPKVFKWQAELQELLEWLDNKAKECKTALKNVQVAAEPPQAGLRHARTWRLEACKDMEHENKENISAAVPAVKDSINPLEDCCPQQPPILYADAEQPQTSTPPAPPRSAFAVQEVTAVTPMMTAALAAPTPVTEPRRAPRVADSIPAAMAHSAAKDSPGSAVAVAETPATAEKPVPKAAAQSPPSLPRRSPRLASTQKTPEVEQVADAKMVTDDSDARAKASPALSGPELQSAKAAEPAKPPQQMNNLVSLVKSFLPCVICAPAAEPLANNKKNIKVKALEVAKAARLEEQQRLEERQARKALLDKQRLDRQQQEREEQQRLEQRQAKIALAEKQKLQKQQLLQQHPKPQLKTPAKKKQMASRPEEGQARKGDAAVNSTSKLPALAVSKQVPGSSPRPISKLPMVQAQPSFAAEQPRTEPSRPALGALPVNTTSKPKTPLRPQGNAAAPASSPHEPEYVISPYKSGSDSDDDHHETKPVPSWARSTALWPALCQQVSCPLSNGHKLTVSGHHATS